MDIHDIARSARTYGVKRYFIVTPLEDQHELVGRILQYWNSDSVREYHPDRFEAVSLVRLAHDFNEVKAAIRAECSKDYDGDPEVVLPDARPLPNPVSYAELRRELQETAPGNKSPESSRPLVIVFGTGWGVSDSFYPEVHRILAPVYGPEGGREGGYNHLSVRAAAAIILDRLFGQ